MGVGAGDRGKQKHPAVAVLVDENVVEAARQLRLGEAADFFDGRWIREPADVEDDRAQVGVGATLAELHRQDYVVTVLPLVVLDVLAAGTCVQVLVLDAPAVDHLGLVRVMKVDDVHPLLAFATEHLARNIRIRARQILFDLDVGDTELGAEWKVGDHLDVVASAFFQRPLLRA